MVMIGGDQECVERAQRCAAHPGYGIGRGDLQHDGGRQKAKKGCGPTSMPAPTAISYTKWAAAARKVRSRSSTRASTRKSPIRNLALCEVTERVGPMIVRFQWFLVTTLRRLRIPGVGLHLLNSLFCPRGPCSVCVKMSVGTTRSTS
jgi:hypothetical protein